MRVYASSRMTRIILMPLKIETEMDFLDEMGLVLPSRCWILGPSKKVR